jgi:hypothetical protein
MTQDGERRDERLTYYEGHLIPPVTLAKCHVPVMRSIVEYLKGRAVVRIYLELSVTGISKEKKPPG